MTLTRHICIYILTLISTQIAFAQQYSAIRGSVRSTDNQPIRDASIRLDNQTTKTLSDGSFSFENVPTGHYTISVSSLGYANLEQKISKNAGETLFIPITLLTEAHYLESIEVTGKTELQLAKEQPIRPIIIDTRAAVTQATNLSELMNRSAGVRIRQSGAVGGNPETSINGFQGKAVKYFKDGIPLDYLGDGYNLSSMPLEILNRIEVYKGVLPVFLGADALGGAVNLVTEKRNSPQLHLNYEIGSFNTHRVGLIGSNQSADQKWAYGAELFFNHSDNDYKALVGIPDPETKNLVKQRVPLFHNAFRSYFGEGHISMQNRSWADELRFAVTAFSINKEQQHPALMTEAYGAVRAKQNTIAPSLRYKKTIMDGRLAFDQFISYNNLESQRIDTLMGSYDWYGNFTPKSSRGESRLPSQSKVNEKQIVARSGINYQLNGSTKLNLNYVFTDAKRKGEDPYGARFDGTDIDVLSIESSYQKHVLGLGFDKYFLKERLHNQTIAKFYHYRAAGLNNTWFSTTVTDKDKRKESGSYWGIAEALKYKLDHNSSLRLSAEYTYRMPEREELFGNNVFVVPNFELSPEKSTNLSLGYQSRYFDKLAVEVNGFYRHTKGLILLVPIQAPNAQYQNQENVRGFGFDLDLSYQLARNYRINANATWQDLRIFGITAAQDAWKNDARLRNTPYFFANAGLQTDYHLFSKNDLLNVFINYNFLREFYLETIPKAAEAGGFLGLSGSANLNSDLVIPDQHMLHAGFTYKLPSGRVNIGAEVRNLLDKDLFDYYRIQRPGRSFHLKLSYNIL